MINVTRQAYLEGFTPAEIFATLSDSQAIAHILPRVQRVEVTRRDDAARTARLVTYMNIGGIFGTIRSEGELSWDDDRAIRFKVRTPVQVETSWELLPVRTGTDIQLTTSLNLAPMLGPMAAFVPTQQVSDMMATELEGVLKALARRMRESRLQERAIAA
jgi:ribosome-associated toxin RatA of RatAB toxin-antitoxin module